MTGFCVVVNKNLNKPLDNTLINSLIEPIVFPGIGRIMVQSGKDIAFGVYDQFYAQPERFSYKDENVLVVCDAEIYNFEDFAPDKDIKGISEAEIIAGLFSKHGIYWYRDVQGVFSVFIWDYRTGQGYAYCDRIGTKPIRYYASHEQVIIASSIKSITALPGFNKELDHQAIFSYISMEMVPTPYTIYRNVKKLESGHLLKITNDGLDFAMLWNMQYPETKLSDQSEIKSKVYEITKNAVLAACLYRNQISEIGSFLSGGTDSSTIAGLINELYPGQARTFSIGFDEQGYDEMYYARIAAKAFGTNHTEYYITTGDILDALPKIINECDEPFANSSVIPAYFCAKLAYEKGVKTMLGGDGGDEIFGGNARYHKHFADFQRFPSWIVDIMHPFMNNLPRWADKSILRKVKNYVKRARGDLSQTIQAYEIFNYIDPDNIFKKEFLISQDFITPMEITRQYLEKSGIQDAIDQYLYHDLKITLMDNDLPKVNRMTQLANVNVRYPFLYPKLVEFTGFIPSNLKVKDGELRYIFKESFKKLLPQEIINKTKHGFGLPIVPWMLRPGKLNDLLTDVVLDARTYQRGIFQKKFLEELYKMSQTDKTPFYGTYLYYILFMEMWLRKHHD